MRFMVPGKQPAGDDDFNRAPSRYVSMGRLLNDASLVALLLVIGLAAIPYGAVEPWWSALFEGLIFALGVLWLISMALGGAALNNGHRLLLLPLVLTGYAFVQSVPFGSEEIAGLPVTRVISADPFETRFLAFKLLALCVTAAILLGHTANSRRLRLIVFTVIGIGVASAIFGIFRQTVQHGEQGMLLPHLTTGRGYAQFINRDHFSFLMEMALGMSLGLMFGGGVARDRLLLLAALALPLWAAAIMSYSRGGIFAILGEISFLLLLYSNKLGHSRIREGSAGSTVHFTDTAAFRGILSAGLLVILIAGVLWIGGEQLQSRFEALPENESAQSGGRHEGTTRHEVWSATWQLITQNPILGAGFGGYWAVIPKFHDASGVATPQQAHSDLLELWASGGMVGLALSAGFIIAFVRRVREKYRESRGFRRAARLGALTGVFGVGLHSLVDFGLHIPVNALVFTCLLVVAAGD